MATQLQHDLLLQANHDELARQNFVQSLKLHLATKVSPGNKVVYEQQAKPRFEKEAQRPPKDRHEVRRVMRDEPYYQTWSTLQRTSQEMMWESVSSSVARQLPAIVTRASQNGTALGSGNGWIASKDWSRQKGCCLDQTLKPIRQMTQPRLNENSGERNILSVFCGLFTKSRPQLQVAKQPNRTNKRCEQAVRTVGS